jgi:hypothetical protein
MKSFALHALLLTLFLLMIGASAQATTLSLEDCASCEGSDVSLDITTADGGATYDVILTLDSESYNGPGDSIVQAGFKAFDGVSAGDTALVSVTSGSWSDPVLSGISSSSFCEGSGNSGFVCTTGESNIVSDPGKYVFTFKVDGTNATLLSEWSIKFQYCDSADYDGGEGDCNGHVISEPGIPGKPGDPGTPVPEPSAALVFAAGLLVAAPKLRRRR